MMFFKFSLNILFMIPYQLTMFQVPSFNTFCDMAVILQGEIIQNKYVSAIFSMRDPYMKFRDDISKERTDGHTDERTNRIQYAPHFFKVGGINRKVSSFESNKSTQRQSMGYIATISDTESSSVTLNKASF